MKKFLILVFILIALFFKGENCLNARQNQLETDPELIKFWEFKNDTLIIGRGISCDQLTDSIAFANASNDAKINLRQSIQTNVYSNKESHYFDSVYNKIHFSRAKYQSDSHTTADGDIKLIKEEMLVRKVRHDKQKRRLYDYYIILSISRRNAEYLIEGLSEKQNLEKTESNQSWQKSKKYNLRNSQSWAVIIGINDYNIRTNGYRYLPYAVADADSVKKFLLDSLGFQKNHVFAIYNEKATYKNIKALIGDTLRKKLNDRLDDRLLIYFSGHGDTLPEKTETLNGYLVPIDGKKDSPHSTCISMVDIGEWSNIINARQILFIIDACFGGRAGLINKGSRAELSKVTRAKLSKVTRAEVEHFIASRGRQIISAAASDEEAFMDRREKKHSVFTYYLLEGLKGKADFNHDNVISVEELHLYVYDKVSYDTNAEQNPQLYPLGKTEGQFIFYKEGTF